jgi:hypothetical protein
MDVPVPSNCSLQPYLDNLDLMGYSGNNNFGALSSPAAARLGFNYGTVTVPLGTREARVTLSAVSTYSGSRTATAVDPITGETYYFEFRANHGVDSGLAGYGYSDSLGRPQIDYDYGVRVVKLATNQPGGVQGATQNTTNVILNGAGASTARGNFPRAASFLPRQAFVNHTGAITMRVDAIMGTTATVTITVARPPGMDTLAIRRGNQFTIRDDAGGTSKITFGKASDKFIVGDWDGDGIDTLAIRRGNLYIVGGVSFRFGKSSDQILVGGWDGDGIDTLALRRGTKIIYRNTLTSGATTTFTFGKSSDQILVGDWDG